MSDVMVKLDEELLALIQERADETGRPRDEVITEALRRGLATRTLQEIVEPIRARSNLSEDEAMRLAIEEQRADRRERAARTST